MIVVVIVGILAAVAVPSYRKYVVWSRAQEPLTLLPQVRLKEEMYFQDNNRFLSTGAYPRSSVFQGDPQPWGDPSTHSDQDVKNWAVLQFQPATRAVYFRYWVKRVRVSPGGIVDDSSDNVTIKPTGTVANTCGGMIRSTFFDVTAETFVACADGSLRTGSCASDQSGSCAMRFGMSGVIGQGKVHYTLD